VPFQHHFPDETAPEATPEEDRNGVMAAKFRRTPYRRMVVNSTDYFSASNFNRLDQFPIT
jgi:hypothetical protein